MNTTSRIQALADALTRAKFSANIWAPKGKDASRIYLNGYGKDIKAYLAFDNAETAAEAFDGGDLMAGARLCVWSNCEESRNWLINRAKEVKHTIMLELYHNDICTYKPCKRWQDIEL